MTRSSPSVVSAQISGKGFGCWFSFVFLRVLCGKWFSVFPMSAMSCDDPMFPIGGIRAN
jgi:hypothetical protein